MNPVRELRDLLRSWNPSVSGQTVIDSRGGEDEYRDATLHAVSLLEQSLIAAEEMERLTGEPPLSQRYVHAIWRAVLATQEHWGATGSAASAQCDQDALHALSQLASMIELRKLAGVDDPYVLDNSQMDLLRGVFAKLSTDIADEVAFDSDPGLRAHLQSQIDNIQALIESSDRVHVAPALRDAIYGLLGFLTMRAAATAGDVRVRSKLATLRDQIAENVLGIVIQSGWNALTQGAGGFPQLPGS